MVHIPIYGQVYANISPLKIGVKYSDAKTRARASTPLMMKGVKDYPIVNLWGRSRMKS